MSRARKTRIADAPMIIETARVDGVAKLQLDMAALLRIVATSRVFRVSENWKKLLRGGMRDWRRGRRLQGKELSYAAWRIWLVFTSKLLGVNVLSSRHGRMTKGIRMSLRTVRVGISRCACTFAVIILAQGKLASGKPLKI